MAKQARDNIKNYALVSMFLNINYKGKIYLCYKTLNNLNMKYQHVTLLNF